MTEWKRSVQQAGEYVGNKRNPFLHQLLTTSGILAVVAVYGLGLESLEPQLASSVPGMQMECAAQTSLGMFRSTLHCLVFGTLATVNQQSTKT